MKLELIGHDERYIVEQSLMNLFPGLGGEYPPVENPYAMGNAWFVDSLAPAASPDEEIALIGKVDPAKTAVIGKDFATATGNFGNVSGTTPSVMSSTPSVVSSTPSVMSSEVETSPDQIALTYYAPNELRYSFSTTTARPAIFSEIYYPKGWKAWIEPTGAYGEVRNGHYRPTAEAKPVELFRTDWILRGAILPKGEGELIMRFEPDSYQLGENISTASSVVLILLLLLSVAGILISGKKEQD